MFLTRISINNPVFAAMMMFAFVVLGLFGYQRMAVDQFPEISFPIVVVQTDYPGASPESVEFEISRRIEETVNTVSGIKNLTSRSYEGTSVVIIEFELTINPAQAAQDVREKVAIVKPSFRKEINEPKITRFDPSERPVIWFAIRSGAGRDARELTTLADNIIRKRFETVRGVGSVQIAGASKREVQIRLKPDRMEALGVSVDQVSATLKAENQDLPMGPLKTPTQELTVQTRGKLARPDDFGQLIVARRGGAVVRLSQVAEIYDGAQEPESSALYNGQRTIAMGIVKAQGENTIAVVDAVKARAKLTQAELPSDVSIDVIADGSVPIRTSVNNVRQTIFEGAGLTIAIVFLFLGSWRSTIITGLTLPVALIGTFLFMAAFGFTINMLTLMALSLCVGLLIDDAIVVRENIVRHVAMGKDARQASLDGTQEIGLAVLATTFSIVAVFLPIGFMGGIIGRFFHQFGITVVAAVLISMFVSLTLDPMLSSIWHDPAIHGHGQVVKRKGLGRLLDWHEAMITAFSRLYQKTLALALRNWITRVITVAIAIGTLVLSMMLAKTLGSEFVPQADYSETNVTFQTPVGSALEYTEEKARQVDAALRAMPEIAYTLATINSGSASGKHVVSIYVRLVDRKQRSASQKELTRPIRERLSQIAGITLTSVGLTEAVGGEKAVVFQLLGPDLKVLEALNEQVLAKVQDVQGLVDLDTSLKPARPTVDIAVNRAMASDAGLTSAAINAALRPLIAGDAVTTWRAEDGQDYDVRVRLTPSARVDADDLRQLSLGVAGSSAGDGIPRQVKLGSVATITPGTGPTQINRRELTREVRIDGNVYGRSVGEVAKDVQAILDTIDYPPGYRYSFGGSAKNMQESFSYAAQALLLAVIFIYMILASQFNSFIQPIAIMMSLPLTLIGVIGALLIFRSTMNMFAIIGFILLMGLVTKNAILLIDFVNQARRQGEERIRAILLAADVRLRPILMTTLAMIFGMLPLALGVSEGSEQRAPMGQAVIGGVITSSVLTLVVVPVVYLMLDDMVQGLRRLLHWRRKSHG